MITNIGLKQLGFSKEDYALQDDGDGTFIARWSSDQPQPSVTAIETAHAEWQANYEAEQIQAEANKASAISKLEALGLTDAEIKALSGGL